MNHLRLLMMVNKQLRMVNQPILAIATLEEMLNLKLDHPQLANDLNIKDVYIDGYSVINTRTIIVNNYNMLINITKQL